MFSKIKAPLLMLVLLGFVLGLAGCETMKGAAEGLQRDWENVKQFDSWMRDNLW